MNVGTTRLRANWEPFGRPLFKDRAARALSRVGVVDVGSNSERLAVFDGAGRSPAYFYNEKIMCSLGVDMSKTNRLTPRASNAPLSTVPVSSSCQRHGHNLAFSRRHRSRTGG